MFGGIVIKGDGLGRQYGFPTANLNCKKKDIKFKAGVYAAWGFINKKKYKAALVIQEEPWKVEVYLVDFEGDLYEKYIEVDLVQKVSELERFENTQEIIEKIHLDIKMIKEILS